MKLSGYQRKRARIEIIPLIDIVFFLLATFVMVSLSMVPNRGVSVSLPVAVSGEALPMTPVTISVGVTGDVYWNDDHVTVDELRDRLSQLQARQPHVGVIIQGDKASPLAHTMAVLDCVRQQGIRQVSIRTRS